MRLIALVLSLLFAANSAAAEDLEKHAKTVGTWDIYFTARYCTARSIYGGQNIGFAINPWQDDRLVLQVHDAKWNVPDGTYNVNVQVDSISSNKEAKIVGQQSMFLYFELKESVVELFRHGREMWITAKGAQWGYQLNNTQIMLPELIKCAATLRHVIDGNKNPFGSANSKNNFGGTSNPFGTKDTKYTLGEEVDPFN